MSVHDIIFSAGASIPTNIRKTWYEVMPVEDASANNLYDMQWSDICFDNVDTFAALREFNLHNRLTNRIVSFSNSLVPGQSWINASNPNELLEDSTVTAQNRYSSICGNAGTFIVTGVVLQGVNSGIIQRLKYNSTTNSYDRTSVFKILSGSNPPADGVVSGVTFNYHSAYCSAYGNGTFVVGGKKWIAYSRDDGLTWKTIPTSFDANINIVYADSPTVGKVFVIATSSYAGINDRVIYLSFNSSNELVLNTVSKPSSGVCGGRIAYSNGIFLYYVPNNKFLFTRDLNNFYAAPNTPNNNLVATTIMTTTTGNMVGYKNYFIVVSANQSNIFIDKTSKNYLSTTAVNNTLTAVQKSATTRDPSYDLTEFFYSLEINLTGNTWNSTWKKIPLEYITEAQSWPPVSPNTYTKAYARSEVGPYNAMCVGKDVLLAPRHLGDRLTILNENTLL